MKTEQKLEIPYEGFVITQTMKEKMVYVESLMETAMTFEKDVRIPVNRNFNRFYSLQDTKDFVEALKQEEWLKESEVVRGIWRNKKIHELLAIKYCTWISKKFEIFIYKFFLEYYPEIRELGGDKYNDFRNNCLPKVYDGNNDKFVVINMNKYINKLLEKENWRNKESKEHQEARVHIYKNIIADIEMGEKPKVKEKIGERINKKIENHLARRKIMKDRNIEA